MISELIVPRQRAAWVTTVIAHMPAVPNASTKVLSRHGFVQTDTIEDPDDGAIWRWEKPRTS